jgi:hypothetical protein
LWDKASGELNAVTAGLAIICHHDRLMGNQLNYSTPLVIQHVGDLVPLYIMDDGTKQTLRNLAQHTYQLDPVKDAAAIQHWSRHLST